MNFLWSRVLSINKYVYKNQELEKIYQTPIVMTVRVVTLGMTRPFIATPQPLSSSPNTRRLRCFIWSLGHSIYSSSSTNNCILVVDFSGQSAWHHQLSPSCRSLRCIVSNYFPLTPPLSLLITQSCIPPPTTALSRYPLSERLIIFRLLTSYFKSWWLALVTVGRASTL